MRKSFWITLLIIAVLAAVVFFISRRYFSPTSRTGMLLSWLRNPEAHPEWAVSAGERCQDAPFILPTDGLIGYLWDDSFRLGHRHQGIDIFGGTNPGETPVFAVYDGYLTRLADWKSTVIIRIPEDPLHTQGVIWTYYTHMADAGGRSFIISDFPPGSYEIFVQAGTLLGYQGNYSGELEKPVGVHLHFSIVKADDEGHFLNELDINNTLDPSQYFNLPLNAYKNSGQVPVCNSDN